MFEEDPIVFLTESHDRAPKNNRKRHYNNLNVLGKLAARRK